MKLDTKLSAQRRGGFLVMLLILGYVLLSAGIALNTVDKCGDESAPKHWSFFPPEWVCERQVGNF